MQVREVKRIDLRNHETVITKDRLAELERKERAHDAYLWAVRRMADLSRHVCSNEGYQRPFVEGFEACLVEFSQAVVDAPVLEAYP